MRQTREQEIFVLIAWLEDCCTRTGYMSLSRRYNPVCTCAESGAITHLRSDDQAHACANIARPCRRGALCLHDVRVSWVQAVGLVYRQRLRLLGT